MRAVIEVSEDNQLWNDTNQELFDEFDFLEKLVERETDE